jgi:hypothetical protein
MQAPVLKRSQINDYLWPALALALVVAIGYGIATVDWPNDNDASETARPAELSLLIKEQRYYDAKMARLAEVEAASGAQYVPAPQVSSIEWDPGVAGEDHFQVDQRVTLPVIGGFHGPSR